MKIVYEASVAVATRWQGFVPRVGGVSNVKHLTWLWFILTVGWYESGASPEEEVGL